MASIHQSLACSLYWISSLAEGPGIRNQAEYGHLGGCDLMPATSARVSYRASRRGKFEIWSALLEACLRTPRTQSWLMRKVGLNTAAAKDALSNLTQGGLLEQASQPTVGIFEFRTTEKGKEALAKYYQLITYFFENNPSATRPVYSLPLIALVSQIILKQIL
jgi:predicted transcriptional regulator